MTDDYGLFVISYQVWYSRNSKLTIGTEQQCREYRIKHLSTVVNSQHQYMIARHNETCLRAHYAESDCCVPFNKTDVQKLIKALEL